MIIGRNKVFLLVKPLFLDIRQVFHLPYFFVFSLAGQLRFYGDAQKLTAEMLEIVLEFGIVDAWFLEFQVIIHRVIRRADGVGTVGIGNAYHVTPGLIFMGLLRR